MAKPITPKVFYADAVATYARVLKTEEQVEALGLTDLLPDVPRDNNYLAWKEWHRQMSRGPVTEEGMLEAYRRGVQAGLKDAAQTANTVWKTDNDPKAIAEALDSMARSPAYVSAIVAQGGK